MSAWDIRALLSKVSGTNLVRTRNSSRNSKLVLEGMLPLGMMRRAGRAMGRALGAGDAMHERGSAAFDRLEDRVLLDGSFATPLPLTDLGGSQFEAANFINPAVVGTNNDTFRFTATANGFVSVLADTRNETQPNTLNTRVRVFNNAQQLISTGANNGVLTSGTANDGWVGFVAETGQSYFIIVDAENVGALTTGNTYTVRVNARNVAFNPTADVDPADPTGDIARGIGREAGSGAPIGDPDFAPASPIPYAVTPILGELGRLQQDIVYTYTVPVGNANEAFDSLVSLNAQVTQGDQTIRLDSRLDVYRVNGTTGAVTNIASDSDSGRRNDAFTTFRARPGETVFIRVRSDETRPGVVTTGTGTGSFYLVFDGAAADLPNAMNPVLRRGSDPGIIFNGFLDPTTPSNPVTPKPAFQTQLYRFTAQGTGLAIVTLSSQTPTNDAALRIFDDLGNLIAFNNNFQGLAAQLEVQLIGGRRYFVIADGYEINTGRDFQLFVESNHTSDQVTGVDDHIDNPGPLGGFTPAGRQLILKDATGLRWGQPFDTFDGDGNLVRDLGQKVRAVGQGRIQGAGDTDLFRFDAPVDMLAAKPGNNDDLGTSLFVGGSFNFAGPGQSRPTTSNGLVTWDANDYWAVGNQQLLNPPGVQLGFTPRAGGAATAQILALQTYDFDGPGGFNPILFVGGDFTVNFIDPATGQIVSLNNLVGWFLNPATGTYTFIDVTGGANPTAPVRAFAIFDPIGYDPDGSGPAITLVDPNAGQQPWLAVGGDFATIGGVASAGLAIFNGGWIAAPNGGVDPAGGVTSVRALVAYDAPDPGPGRTDPAPVIADPIDVPNSLWIGGVFSGAGNTVSLNLIRWDGQLGNDAAGQPGFATPVIQSVNPPAWTLTGAVNSLVVWNDAPDPDGPGEDGFAGGQYISQNVLIVGGAFTTIGGVVSNRVSSFGWLDRNADDPTGVQGVFNPQLDWIALGAGVADGEVFALNVWDPVDETRPGERVRAPQLIVGGRFNNAGGNVSNNIASFTRNALGAPIWTAFTDAFGLNPGTVGRNPANPNAAPTAAFGAVRALTSYIDVQEPSIPFVDENVLQSTLYIGGDFSQITNVLANSVAQRFFAEPGGNPDAFGAGTWDSLNPQFAGAAGGVQRNPVAVGQPNRPGQVFALAAFDDGNAAQWDRHDRPASRLEIVVAPAEGSFLNSEVRVFDSQFNLVFAGNSGINLDATPWATTRGGSSFPFDTSRSGMIDPASSFPAPQTQVIGIPVWGGETYYIEISGQSTGRYTLTVVADAFGDAANAPFPTFNPNDVNAVVTEEPDEGQFIQANFITTQLGNGDGDNAVNSSTQNPGPPPNGNIIRNQKFSPFFGAFSTGGDFGNISTIDDTDLFSFRAEFTGTVEIRVQTTGIIDTFGQWLGADFTSGAAGTDGNKIISSQLDSVLRAYRNDFEQVAYNDDNPALQGLVQQVFFASEQDPVAYWSRDARLVIPIIAGNVYYVQVESAQRWKSGADQDPANRVANIEREIDWRYATGSYRLQINQLGNNLLSFVENGTEIRDDISNQAAGFDQATFIPLGTIQEGPTLNGVGTISGVINNPPVPLPADDDLYSIIAPGSGTITINVSRTAGSNINSDVTLLDQFGNVVGTGSNVGAGVFRITRTGAIAGEQYFIRVAGSGGSEGGYRIDVTTGPEVDDYADDRNFADAQDIILRDFAGTGNISGNIEVAGDTDLFRISAEQFQQLTVTVTATDATLDPFVWIYEVSEDPAGNPVLLLVNANDDFVQTETAARTTFSVSPNREKQGPPIRTFPFYYILVGGAAPNTDFGGYNVSISFPATDDHADGDTNRDGTIDTPFSVTPRIDEFNFATPVTVDNQSGQGASEGNIEIDVDSDLFFFTAPAGGNVVITLNRPIDSLLRLRLDVIDSQGNIVGNNTGADSATAPFNATVSFIGIRGGTYFVVARGATPNTQTQTTGRYTLTISAQPIDDLPNQGETALSNATANITLNTLTGVGTRTGQIGDINVSSFLSDTDLLTFIAPTAGAYTVRITPLTAAPLGLAPRLRLIDADGTTVLQDISATNRREVVTTISFNAIVGQRFYVLVNAASSFPISIGEYEVTVTGPVGGIGGGGGTDPSIVDLPAATTINLDPRTGDGSVNDIIEIANDRDAYRFTTFAAGRTFVQITTPNGSLLNASLRILNAANEQPISTVTFDADGIPGATANIAFNATTNTTYWLIVDGLGDSVGSYTISVNTLPFVNRLVFPEGFTSDIVREFVSIVNPNPVTATYTLTLRYERNITPLVVATATIGPNARGGVTISDGLNFRTPGVLANEPYAIVLESDFPLGATVAHYDFGTAVGDSMTEETSESWTFASVQRDPGSILDFITFYNPNNFGIDVTITAFANGQAPVSLSRSFDALRRGGFSINDITNFPTGTFSLVLTSRATNIANAPAYIGVVASLSHYDTVVGAGFALLGQSTAAREGVITNLAVGSSISSQITLFNPNLAPATVVLTGTYVRQDLPSFNRTIQVPGRGNVTLTGNLLGLVADQPAAITYTSDQPINAASSQLQRGDADSSRPLTSAGTRYFFGDAYIQRDLAGSQYFETLYFYNPTDRDTTVSITLLFNQGVAENTAANDPLFGFRNRTFTVTLPAKSARLVNLHERAEILGRPTVDNFFAIDASSNVPFVMTMTHYDLFLGGGWANDGAPFGIVTPLSLIP